MYQCCLPQPQSASLARIRSCVALTTSLSLSLVNSPRTEFGVAWEDKATVIFKIVLISPYTLSNSLSSSKLCRANPNAVWSRSPLPRIEPVLPSVEGNNDGCVLIITSVDPHACSILDKDRGWDVGSVTCSLQLIISLQLNAKIWLFSWSSFTRAWRYDIHFFTFYLSATFSAYYTFLFKQG